jgi:hypothetical protein
LLEDLKHDNKNFNSNQSSETSSNHSYLESLSLAGCYKINIKYIINVLSRDYLGVVDLNLDGLNEFVHQLKGDDHEPRMENTTIKQLHIDLNPSEKEFGELEASLWMLKNIRELFQNIEEVHLNSRTFTTEFLNEKLPKFNIRINGSFITPSQLINQEQVYSFISLEKLIGKYEEKRSITTSFRIDDEVLKSMAHFQSFGDVEEMNLNNCTGVSDLGFRYILREDCMIFKKLLFLRLRNTQITITSLYKLIDSKQLSSQIRLFDIYRCKSIQTEELRVFFEFLELGKYILENNCLLLEYRFVDTHPKARLIQIGQRKWITDYFELE